MKTHRLFRVTTLSALALSAVAGAQTQGATWDICRPADPATPLHDAAFGNAPPVNLENQLFGVVIGRAGTTTYGSNEGFCFAPNAVTANAAGRFAFYNGSLGSVQSSFDDNMALTFGAPNSPGASWGSATISQGPVGGAATSAQFGTAGFSTFFNGASDRYAFARSQQDDVQINARWDLVGDACRIQWTLTNLGEATLAIGMNVGHYVALLSNTLESRGAPFAPTQSNGPVFVDAPGRRPLIVEQRFGRTTDPSGYPAEINFLFDQARPYGLRINNTQTTATIDPSDQNQSLTNVDQVVVGTAGGLLDAPFGNDVDAFPDTITQEPISDIIFTGIPAYIQKYAPQPIAVGASRTVVQFYNSPWSDAAYGRPYSVVVDKPRTINLSSTNAAAFEQSSYTLRVYVDNIRGFATVNQELPLEEVNVTLEVGEGLNVVGGATRTITRVEPRAVNFVDFQITPDATASGDLTYTVRTQPSPGPVKTVTGTIRVSSQPRLPIYNGANLVTSPFVFANPVWEEILGLEFDTDFQAFAWDPQQSAYVIQTGPVRGYGTWIVSRADRGVITLGSEPQKATDETEEAGGAPLITLRQGWNLIGNPYPISIPVGQFVGSSNANQQGAFTFAQLVQQGIVSGSLAYWDNPNQTYRFIQGNTARLEPQRGYWIYVFTEQDLILRYPPVYQPGYRSTTEKDAWVQSDKQWKLQLAARTSTTADDQNFIGLAKTPDVAKTTRVYEPPMAPIKGAVSVSVESDVDGKTRSLAQSLAAGGDRQTFKVKVESRDAGPVTLTWPNLSTIPKNVRVRLTDTATGETRDLRKFSGYTFTSEARATRNLTLQVEPGFANRVVIGNVVATRDTRAGGPNAPFNINYTLAADATTSVRILGANGREVFTATRGRADKAGSNSVVWNLRDNANRAVAPGTYRVEVLAEGDNGERVRKFYPITLVR